MYIKAMLPPTSQKQLISPRKHIPWERLKVNLPHGVIVRAERRGAVGLSSRYWRGLNFPIKVTGL